MALIMISSVGSYSSNRFKNCLNVCGTRRRELEKAEMSTSLSDATLLTSGNSGSNEDAATPLSFVSSVVKEGRDLGDAGIHPRPVCRT